MSLLARFGVLLVAMGALLALPSRPGPTYAATTDVNVGNFWFCNSSFQGSVCTTTIIVGDTVTWHFTIDTPVAHTTTSNTAIWNSGKVASGGTFSHTFSSPGTFAYVCTNHPTLMMGQITVAASVGGIAQLPDVANAPLTGAASSSSSGVGLIAGSAAIVAGLFALGGAGWYARRRRVS